MKKTVTTLRRLISKENGITAIEFSIVFPLFVFIMFFIFEVCRYLFISVAMDLTLSEAARKASMQSSKKIDYQSIFRETIKSQSGFWAGLINVQDISGNVIYCKKIEQAIQGKCDNFSSERIIAIYKISYSYRPLLVGNLVPGTEKIVDTLKNNLSHQLIYVQEYERNVMFKTE